MPCNEGRVTVELTAEPDELPEPDCSSTNVVSRPRFRARNNDDDGEGDGDVPLPLPLPLFDAFQSDALEPT